MQDPFAQIQGQFAATQTLQKAVDGDRLHHAWIFHGPRGVGKMTTALAFGKWLLDDTILPQEEVLVDDGLTGLDAPSGGEGDDEALLRSGHPDLHVVTKELARYSSDAAIRNRKLTTIPVEVLRTALIEPVNRAATCGGRKVFIVDEAELLNEAGQNALLKTLEEPPPGTILILVTPSEDKLLPTIRSRCQRVGFLPLHDGVVRDWVSRRVADQAGLEIAPAMIDWVVTFSSGSLGRAALAVDWKLTDWAQVVLPAIDGAAQGRPDGQLGATMAALIDGFAKDWVDGHKNASKEAANKMAADLMWALIANHARHKLHTLSSKLGADDPVAGDATLDPWLKTIDATEQGKAMLGSNVNMGMACDLVAILIAGAFDRSF